MSVYLVGQIDIEDPYRHALYQPGSVEAVSPYAVEILSTDGRPEIVDGVQPANHLFVIRSASGDKFRRFYRSERYHAVVEHRLASTAQSIMNMPDSAAEADHGPSPEADR